MKKRLLALMMAAMMAFALAACGSDDAGNNGQSNAPDSSSPAGEQSSEPDGTNADFKVGAIYINSKNDTAGYTYAHNNGITTAMKDLGLDVDSQLVIVDEVAEDYEAVSTAVEFNSSFSAMQVLLSGYSYPFQGKKSRAGAASGPFLLALNHVSWNQVRNFFKIRYVSRARRAVNSAIQAKYSSRRNALYTRSSGLDQPSPAPAVILQQDQLHREHCRQKEHQSSCLQGCERG